MEYCVTGCPKCGMFHITFLHAKTTRCPFCNHVYTLRPKRSMSRIVFHGTGRDCREFIHRFKVRP